jgi:hypothetical protein
MANIGHFVPDFGDVLVPQEDDRSAAGGVAETASNMGLHSRTSYSVGITALLVRPQCWNSSSIGPTSALEGLPTSGETRGLGRLEYGRLDVSHVEHK